MVEFTSFRPAGGTPRLVPATRADLDVLGSIRFGQRLRTAVTFDRSHPHSRWFHKLLDVAADGLGQPREWLKTELKLRTGKYFVHTSPTFGVVVNFKSTAFAAMDEIEFNEFRKVAVEVLFTDFLPGVHRKGVYEQVYDLLGEPCPWADAA